MYCSILHKPCKQMAHAFTNICMQCHTHYMNAWPKNTFIWQSLHAVQLARDRLTLTTRREVVWYFLVCCDILITTCGAEWNI